MHPQVTVDLVLSDQNLDLIQDGIDMAFRVGQLEDSSLIGRHLGDVRAMLCASPEYLEKHAAPTHPDHLQEHSQLTAQQWKQWQMIGPDEEEVTRSEERREGKE